MANVGIQQEPGLLVPGDTERESSLSHKDETASSHDDSVPVSAKRSPETQLSQEMQTERGGDVTDCSDDEPWDMDDSDRVLTHKEAMEQFRDGVAELILGDPLLNDVSAGITLEEVNSLIALEHGQAITVNVHREDGIILPVVVVQNGTVFDLKKAIQGHVALKQSREDGPQHISWRYIWRSYWLYFEGQKLAIDHKKIKDYGIKNHDSVTFIKRLKQK